MKTLSIILLTFILYGCGYTPMFSSNSQTRVNVEELIITGDRELSNFIKEKINRLDNKSGTKKVSITVSTSYSKESQTKDKSGNTTQYKLNANVNFIIKTEKSTKEINLSESSSMNNFSDEFEQRNYERSTKDQFSSIFINQLIISLSRIE
jgi:hypothetical protein